MGSNEIILVSLDCKILFFIAEINGIEISPNPQKGRFKFSKMCIKSQKRKNFELNLSWDQIKVYIWLEMSRFFIFPGKSGYFPEFRLQA